MQLKFIWFIFKKFILANAAVDVEKEAALAENPVLPDVGMAPGREDEEELDQRRHNGKGRNYILVYGPRSSPSKDEICTAFPKLLFFHLGFSPKTNMLFVSPLFFFHAVADPVQACVFHVCSSKVLD